MAITWETVDLPAPEPLYERYRRDPTGLSSRFELDPRDPGWLSRRLTSLGDRTFPREDLARALIAYNLGVGGGDAALAHAAALGRPGAVAVAGGQQAGLLTGPLYTIGKAVTIIQLARDLGRRLDVPVVPCFWVAAEDHDLAEVDHCWLVDAEGTPKRLELELLRRGRRPVAAVAPGSAAERVLDQVEAVVPPSEHREAILVRLRETAGGATDLADWFARIMAWLFAPWGLVLVNPADRNWRLLARPMLGRLLERAGDLAGAVEEGTRAVRALGYEPQFQPRPGQAHLFLSGPRGDRLPLFLAPEGGFRVGDPDARVHLGPEAAAKLAEAEFWRFSASVVSRPLVQEAVLPVLAQVAGPGETGYSAQLKEAFRLFGFGQPVLWPRLSLTIADGPVRRLMGRYAVDLCEGPAGLRERREQVLAGLDDTGFERAFDAARADTTRRYEQLSAVIAPLEPAMERMAAVNRARVLAELDHLRERARRAHRERHRVVVGHFGRLEGHLFPRGQWQERVLNVIPWLCRYGQSLISWLVNSPLDTEYRHRLLLP